MEETMRYLKECAIIFGITLAGELLNAVLPLPVPAGVYGLFLLLLCLCTGAVKLADVEATGNFLLDIMPVMFVPAAAGLLDKFGVMKPILLPLFLICLASTLIVMGATGKVTDWILGAGKEPDGAETKGTKETRGTDQNGAAMKKAETKGGGRS